MPAPEGITPRKMKLCTCKSKKEKLPIVDKCDFHLKGLIKELNILKMQTKYNCSSSIYRMSSFVVPLAGITANCE